MKLLLRLTALLLIAASGWAQTSDRTPLSRREVEDLLNSGVPQKRVAALIQQYGIQFIPDTIVVASLRDKGAGDDVIEAARKFSVDHSTKTAQDLLAKGLYEDAEVSLQNAISVDDTDPKIWAQLGDVQRQRRESEKALTSYRRAHDLFPENAQISVKLANSFIDSGDATSAATLCREVARTNPEESGAHLCLAKSYLKQGDSENAVREADKAHLLGSRDPALYSITPNTVMARFIAAIGGAAMLRTVRSLHQIGVEQYNGPNGVVTYDDDDYVYLPDRYVHQVKSVAAKVDARAVYSPAAAFITNGQQSRDLTAEEKANYATSLAVGILSVGINYNQPGYTYKASGTELIDGKLTAVVDITVHNYSTRWYIDPDSGYLVRIVRTINGKQGTTELSNWRTTDGISLPTHTVYSSDGKLVSTFDLKSFDINPPDNPALFVRPAAAAAPTTAAAAGSTTNTAPAGARRILVVSNRTNAHMRQSSSDIYYTIVDDLMSYLRQSRVPLALDNGGRPLDFGKNSTVRTALVETQRNGAANLLLLTVDRPFSAWVKISAQYYDVNGALLWEESSDARGLIEMGPPGIQRALDKIRRKLATHIQQRTLPTY